jgi:hypothetical protein
MEKIRTPTPRQATKLAKYFLIIFLASIAGYFFFSIFNQLPIGESTLAMDWKGLWAGLHKTWPVYGNSTGLRIAPWSLWTIWPIAQLPFTTSWAVLSLLTLAALIFSVPRTPQRKGIWLLSILLLTTSFFSLRHMADGNLEGVIITGLVLLLYGFETKKHAILALGLLMATAKMQEVWLFLVVLGIYLLKTWEPRDWMRAGGNVAIIAVPAFILLGSDWIFGMVAIKERGSIMDSSLLATGGRLGIPQAVLFSLWASIFLITLWVSLKTPYTFSREKVGMLICASLILAPYMAGNSFLTILAISIIPLFQANLLLGGLLIVGVNVLYFASSQTLYNWSATYVCGLTLLTWLIMLARVYLNSDHRFSTYWRISS